LDLENNELNFNLKLQEKMNKILSTEVQRLKRMMKNNHISLTEEEDEDDGSNKDFEYESDNLYGNNDKKVKGYNMSKHDRIEEVEDSHGSYYTENHNIDHSGVNSTSNTKDLKNSRTEGRPPNQSNFRRNNDDYLGIKNGSKDNALKNRSSPDRRNSHNLRSGSQNKINAKTDVDKIRSEIAQAQEVINSMQIPQHLQDRISSSKNDLYEGIQGTGIGLRGNHPSTSSGINRGRINNKERSLSKGIKSNMSKKSDNRTDRSRDIKKKPK